MAINGNQWQSMAINGNYWYSIAINGIQWHLMAVNGTQPFPESTSQKARLTDCDTETRTKSFSASRTTRFVMCWRNWLWYPQLLVVETLDPETLLTSMTSMVKKTFSQIIGIVAVLINCCCDGSHHEETLLVVGAGLIHLYNYTVNGEYSLFWKFSFWTFISILKMNRNY